MLPRCLFRLPIRHLQLRAENKALLGCKIQPLSHSRLGYLHCMALTTVNASVYPVFQAVGCHFSKSADATPFKMQGIQVLQVRGR